MINCIFCFVEMRKVSQFVQNVLDAYKSCSNKFHEHYQHEFNTWLHTLHFGNRSAFNYDHELLNKFIDSAMLYRLGYTDSPPSATDFIYDLNPIAECGAYETTLSKVMDELIHDAIPGNLVETLYGKLQIYDLPDPVVMHVMKLVETRN